MSPISRNIPRNLPCDFRGDPRAAYSTRASEVPLRTPGDTVAHYIEMYCTCFCAEGMSKMIQIRHVPDSLHATLKARAALAGKPLTDYLLAELRRFAEHLTPEELAARLVERDQPKFRTSPAKAVRAERDRP